MSDLVITKDFSITHWDSRLRFTGDKPVNLGYCRVSTDEQADECYSLENQQKRIREWLDRKYGKGKYHLILIVEDESGTLPYDRGGMAKGTYRPGLTLAVEICRRQKLEMFVVARLNRLIRKARIFYELDDDILQPNGIELHAIHESISNKGTSQRLYAAIVAACAESERDNIVSVSRDGLRSRLDQLYYAGQVPFGWRWDFSRPPRNRRFSRKREDNRGKPRRNIEQHPDQAPYVRKAYDWIRSGKNLHWIAAEFERLEVKANRGGTWTDWAIKKIILNPTHAGLLRYDGKLVQGKHFEHRIVEIDEYYNVVKQFQSLAKVGPALRLSPNHVFGMHCYCAICGNRMRISPRWRCNSLYECTSLRSDGKHPGYSIKICRVENRIVEAIRQLAAEPQVLDGTAARVTGIIEADYLNQENERAKAHRELDKAKQDLIRWCEKFNTSGGSSGETNADNSDAVVFNIYRDELTKRISNLECRLASLQDNENEKTARAAHIQDALGILHDFDALWNAMDIDERKTLAWYLVDYVRFEPQGSTWVKIYLKLTLQDEQTFLVPRRGRGGRSSTGLDSLSQMELTSAYYYINNYSDHQIAEARDVSLEAVRFMKASLIRRTGSSNLAEALEVVRPLVEERHDELLIGVRRGRHFKSCFTCAQINLLVLMAKGLRFKEIVQMTGKSKRAIRSATERLYKKLETHSAKESVHEAQRRHLIDGPTPWSAKPTENQLAVLQQLMAEQNQRQAATCLKISLSALKTRMRCMYDKFGVRNQRELLQFARERGWIE